MASPINSRVLPTDVAHFSSGESLGRKNLVATLTDEQFSQPFTQDKVKKLIIYNTIEVEAVTDRGNTTIKQVNWPPCDFEERFQTYMDLFSFVVTQSDNGDYQLKTSERLLDGGQMATVSQKENRTPQTNNSLTALVRAIRNNDLNRALLLLDTYNHLEDEYAGKRIRYFLEKGETWLPATIKFIEKTGSPSVDCYISCPTLPMVKFLIGQGVPLNETMCNDETPLIHAIQKNWPLEIIDCMLKGGG